MDDVKLFRNAMAESGIEYTLDEAKRAMDATIEFQAEMDRQFIENPEMFDNFKEMTVQDKQRVCREFSENGIEVSPDELEGLIDLILTTQGKDVDDWQ